MGGEDVRKGRAQGQGAKAEGTRLTGNIHARGAACWMLAVTRQSWGWSAVPGTNRGRKARVPRHLMQDDRGFLQSLRGPRRKGKVPSQGCRGWRAHGCSTNEPHTGATRSCLCPALLPPPPALSYVTGLTLRSTGSHLGFSHVIPGTLWHADRGSRQGKREVGRQATGFF